MFFQVIKFVSSFDRCNPFHIGAMPPVKTMLPIFFPFLWEFSYGFRFCHIPRCANIQNPLIYKVTPQAEIVNAGFPRFRKASSKPGKKETVAPSFHGKWYRRTGSDDRRNIVPENWRSKNSQPKNALYFLLTKNLE